MIQAPIWGGPLTPAVASWPLNKPGIHTDGSAWLQRDAGLDGVSNSTSFTLSFWFRGLLSDVGFYNGLLGDDGAFVDVNLYVNGTYQARFNMWGLGFTGKLQYGIAYGGVTIGDGDLHHILMAGDTNHATNSMVGVIKVDGVEIASNINNQASGPFSINWAGAAPFKVLNSVLDSFRDGMPGDIAELWFAPGQYTTDDTKFRSGPATAADLGADGSTPTGTAPALYFSGNAASFPTNLGTGGVFVLNGSLTTAV